MSEIMITKLEKSAYARKYEYKQQRSDSPFAPSRVFLDFGESVWEHLSNRRSRDYNTLRPLIAKKLEEMGIKFEKLSWSRYAGCDMCPCSGGFVLKDGEVGVDYWAKIETLETEEPTTCSHPSECFIEATSTCGVCQKNLEFVGA
jgi:hypothetical protein